MEYGMKVYWSLRYLYPFNLLVERIIPNHSTVDRFPQA